MPILCGAGGVYLWLRQQLFKTHSPRGSHMAGRCRQSRSGLPRNVGFADARNSGDDLLVPDELKASLEVSGRCFVCRPFIMSLVVLEITIQPTIMKAN